MHEGGHRAALIAPRRSSPMKEASLAGAKTAEHKKQPAMAISRPTTQNSPAAIFI
jgi:hypothetical protein